jgi:CheY-like chemotaxis protein
VDDNQDTAHGMARLLKASGHMVETAHDGPAAFETARSAKPEVILMDLGLPGMDGYEVVRRLRAEGLCRDALVVAISGYGQPQDRQRARDAGFDHHLVKPVDYDRLMALLAEYFTRGRR